MSPYDSNDKKAIAVPTLRRLPVYYYYLKGIEKSGRPFISCSHIAQDMNTTPIQVRKDLEAAGAEGKPKVGYSVSALICILENALGYQNTHEAFLVGAGNLGRALLGYTVFEEYGLKIIAAFDNNPSLIGTEVGGKPVLDVARLDDLVRRMNVKIGIITVPYEHTQQTADSMIAAGIKAIWNFAPVHIKAPENIIVQNVNMASSLAVLSNKLNEMEREEN